MVLKQKSGFDALCVTLHASSPDHTPQSARHVPCTTPTHTEMPENAVNTRKKQDPRWIAFSRGRSEDTVCAVLNKGSRGSDWELGADGGCWLKKRPAVAALLFGGP